MQLTTASVTALAEQAARRTAEDGGRGRN